MGNCGQDDGDDDEEEEFTCTKRYVCLNQGTCRRQAIGKWLYGGKFPREVEQWNVGVTTQGTKIMGQEELSSEEAERAG